MGCTQAHTLASFLVVGLHQLLAENPAPHPLFLQQGECEVDAVNPNARYQHPGFGFVLQARQGKIRENSWVSAPTLSPWTTLAPSARFF